MVWLRSACANVADARNLVNHGARSPNSRKVFWYSSGFEPGMERNFAGRIERIDEGGPDDAVLSGPTNAGGESLGAWTILTGIDFPSAGCWRITGEYLGQSLTFVVETVDYRER